MEQRIIFIPNYTKIFEEVFPYYLSIGMSYEQFWHGDPHLVRAYAKAEEYRIRRRNEEMYLQGRYVYEAIGAFAEILPAFPKKGAKINPYLDRPYPMTLAEANEREEEARQKKLKQIKERLLSFGKGGEDNVRNTD